MARYGFAAFVLALCLHGSTAATLVEKESVVRREPQRVQLSSHGELIQSGEKPELATSVKEKLGNDPDWCNLDFQTVAQTGAGVVRHCSGDADSPWGFTTHDANKRMTRATCIKAGELAGAGVTHHNFEVPMNAVGHYEYKHPQGCFKDACPPGFTHANNICYFWNAVDDWATGEPYDSYTVTGTIVCHRPQHLYGAENAQKGCLTGYEVIDNNATCMEAASCLSHDYINNDEFIIGVKNGSKHLDYPRGCFKIEENDSWCQAGKECVYFNPASPLTDTGALPLSQQTGLPTNVKGTPICQVSVKQTWAAGDTHAGAAGGWTDHSAADTSITASSVATTPPPATSDGG